MPTYTVTATFYRAIDDDPTEPPTYDIWWDRDGVERADLGVPTADVAVGDVVDGWTVVVVEENLMVRPEAIEAVTTRERVVEAASADRAAVLAWDLFRGFRDIDPEIRFMDYVVEGPGGYRNDLVGS
jgi:hypothetical protein